MAILKRGMAYFLGESDHLTNHVLPINAMQYSSYSGQMFSGARDGTVKIWLPTERIDNAIDSPNPFVFSEQFKNSESSLSNLNNGGMGTQNDMSESILKLETSISSNPLCFADTKYSNYSISQSFDLHFDWINDLKLVNNDRDLVTCSSDLSIKMVNLHASHHDDAVVHRFPSLHTDYIKKLSAFNFENSIVSGGLDGKAVVWDLNTLKPVNKLTTTSEDGTTPNSIYALANNDTNIITTGGSSNIISLYDKRVKGGKFMGKLIGHQDQIRCLLMNDRFVLSGSSDTSIKLWDLRNWKVYKNFEMHNDSVWSLTTGVDSAPGLLNQASHDEFRVFYSGDRAGNIIKTDMSHFSESDVDEYEEDAIFNRSLDQKLGVSTLVAKSDSPIISLCVETNIRSSDGTAIEPTIFSSNYSNLNRYRVPDVSEIAKYQYLRMSMEFFSMDGLLDANEAEASVADQQSDFYDIVSHLSMDTNNLEILLSLSGVNTTQFPTSAAVDTDIRYTSMFYNIDTGGPSWEFVNAYKESLEENCGDNTLQQPIPVLGDSTIDKTPVEILLNPLPADQVSLIPFNTSALNRFPIVHKPIIAKRMLNNKRHILTMLMDGVITLWDILICKELKTWFNDKVKPLQITKEFIEERAKQMDKIHHQLQTQDTLRNWCDVEIKAGKIMVILRESCLKNLVEIYYDEMIKEYPFLSVDNVPLKGDTKIKVDPDDRFAIIKILLNSFFQQYLLAEWDFDIKLREELLIKRKSIKGSSDSLSKLSEKESDGGSPTSFRKKLTFSKSRGQVPTASQEVSSARSSVYEAPLSKSDVTFLSEIISVTDAASANQEANVYSHIVENKMKYWEKLRILKTLDTSLMLYSNDPIFTAQRQEKATEAHIYAPLIPSKYLPSNLVLTVFEDDPTLGNFREVCSYTLHELQNITHEMMRSLRQNLPCWLVQPLLYDRYPAIEVTRISFQLLECNYLQLAPNQTIQGKSQKKIKRLPQIDGSLKLTSHSMLRVLKILGYVCEKFESKTSEMRDKKPAHEWLVLECKGQELPPTMTLQTIKTIIWKSGTDLELRYRRKLDE